ncbi:MAG: protein kinase [Acidobacteria bacterium]|nr:protein kinase [Acidobacteriota bacterium]
MLAPNTLLQQRYLIKRRLAQGGMGAVYEAEAVHLGRAPVAVKETLFAEDWLREQFQREAAVLARLRHPALPKVSDHFTEGDGQFLVMEFIPGNDLLRMLKAQGQPFDWPQVIAWADRLLDALDYIHTQHPPIIHRDIKPENLKLTPRGELYLLDFGLAKNATTPTHPGGSLHAYTQDYAPPEQIKGTGTDARSDLYSLGATLYHLLTGQPPTDAKFREQVLSHSMPDPLQPIHQINSQIPFAVSAAIAKAMMLDRERRFQTAAEMRAVLQQANQDIAKQAVEAEARRQQAERLRLEEERQVQERALAAQRKLEEERHQQQQRALEEKRKREEAERKRAEQQRQAEAARQCELEQQRREKENPAKEEDTRARHAPVLPAASPKLSRKLIVGLVSLALLALLLYWQWPHQQPATVTSATPPTTSPSLLTSSSPPVSPSAQLAEVLQYEQEFKPSGSKEDFRFRFKAMTDGYLYLVAKDTSGNWATFLTARPTEEMGVRTNRLRAGKDFIFPASYLWLSEQEAKFTLIFSLEPLKQYAFLSAPDGKQLTKREVEMLSELLRQSQAKVSATANGGVINAEMTGKTSVAVEIVAHHKSSGS